MYARCKQSTNINATMAPQTPTKAKRKEWDTPMRNTIQNLRYISHLSKRAIARKTGVPLTSVCRILDFESVRTAPPTRRRPYKIDTETVLKMEKEMNGNYALGSLTVQELIDHFQLHCAPQTLINAFKRKGIGHFKAAQKKFLTIGHKERRECFCKTLRQHKGWTQDDLNYILFSDEAHCTVNQTKIDMVWRRRGEVDGVNQRFRLDKVQKRHPVQMVSVSFWAMIGKGYKSPIVFIPRDILIKPRTRSLC